MHCCESDAAGRPAPSPVRRAWFAHLWSAAQWALPITALTLMPKCPACVAAYVLLITGAGISFAAASALQTTVVWVCCFALVLLGARLVWRTLARFASIRTT